MRQGEATAVMYLLAVLLPPLAALIAGGFRQFGLNLVLTLLGWVPGAVHAVLLVSRLRRHAVAPRLNHAPPRVS